MADPDGTGKWYGCRNRTNAGDRRDRNSDFSLYGSTGYSGTEECIGKEVGGSGKGAAGADE